MAEFEKSITGAKVSMSKSEGWTIILLPLALIAGLYFVLKYIAMDATKTASDAVSDVLKPVSGATKTIIELPAKAFDFAVVQPTTKISSGADRVFDWRTVSMIQDQLSPYQYTNQNGVTLFFNSQEEMDEHKRIWSPDIYVE